MHNEKFSSEIFVELIKHSASDMDVVTAAWVSTKGERSKDSNIDVSTTDVTKVPGLINFLMRERHGSPFEHSYFTFYVKAPIFVWREHMRHRIASYNEESGRYKVLEPEFYIPSRERKLQQIGKTGSYEFIEGSDAQYAVLLTTLRKNCTTAYTDYLQLLNNGIAKEVARMVLPVNIYSSAYVTMNARALMNFLSLRRHADESKFPSYPQREIEMVAEKYEECFKELMPITHASFELNGRVSP
jgi:thymidylate synthase (FAD)